MEMESGVGTVIIGASQRVDTLIGIQGDSTDKAKTAHTVAQRAASNDNIGVVICIVGSGGAYSRRSSGYRKDVV